MVIPTQWRLFCIVTSREGNGESNTDQIRPRRQMIISDMCCDMKRAADPARWNHTLCVWWTTDEWRWQTDVGSQPFCLAGCSPPGFQECWHGFPPHSLLPSVHLSLPSFFFPFLSHPFTFTTHRKQGISLVHCKVGPLVDPSAWFIRWCDAVNVWCVCVVCVCVSVSVGATCPVKVLSLPQDIYHKTGLRKSES